MRLVERYSRQIPVIGEEGQGRLRATAVAVFGIGGLGTLVARYVAGGGFRKVVVIDHDVVSIPDIHRQILYTTKDVGKPKAEVAARVLSEVNPEVEVVPIAEPISPDLADSILKEVDIAVDALDNWASRHVVNKAAVRHGKPLIHGAVQEWYGHVTTIIPRKTPCLEDIFGRFKSLPSCAMGFCPVLGPAVGVVASIMALEVFKTALGAPSLVGRLLVVDLKHMTFDLLEIERNPNCPVCGVSHSMT
ncbi:UBA/THIF-type NAD/FAD binding protein [Pyrobaculum islandicum DSM 4184]|uniref:UBA/THIF-type NAD/FAD binding protein n=1 Tax=Pyrobaculum islandicum (strain DSM 4184 / JCM 9189 / GEO3) TaxID=384616 RepID=A1RTZ4_PYRIL|nr:HesA/MoeB/ThiF family protein [Pyrobaculum islandicum]ABL88426.1 UBA/THIF-type NAD/FAD binding protein [Pyrobaculum islandicum DSM 4184]